MECLVEGPLVKFSGQLNEDADLNLVRESLIAGVKCSPDEPISIDFSGVKRANSCGIRIWIDALHDVKPLARYVNIPEWLVEQLNFVRELSPENVKVHSILAPFYCPASDKYEVVSLTIGENLPILDSYADFAFSLKNSEGLDLEPDFHPEDYFWFIAENAERYRRFNL